MLFASLSAKTPTSAIALTALTPSAFAKWAAKESEAVRNWFAANGFDGKSAGSSALIPSHDGHLSRVIVILSEPASLWDLAALPAKLPEGTYSLDGIKKQDDEEKLALGWLLGSHRFTLHKKGEEKTLTLCVSKKCPTQALTHMAETIAQTRDLISTPAEEMGPQELAAAVQERAKTYGAKVSVIVGDDLLKKNYPSIHAVGRASHRAPRLIDLTWGNPKHPLVTLVGKGVCFDTGGLDLKSGSGMYLMRKDMGGAAVALGVATMVMQRKLRVRLRLLISAVDNAINEKAFRPSDVVTMRGGLTVEIGNTDAEGRMILADALTEGASEKPDLLIDFATLGGARGIFGEAMASLFTKDDALARELMKAGEQTEDFIWRLPLHPSYAEKLKTPFADLNSCPPAPYGNAMIAAAFLEKFVEEAPRALHLDFIGWQAASKAGRPEGGEAMTLRAVLTFLEKRYA
ncbi:MAG: leucyl aminopeptidase family protein [Alphaproteobacteria bacterium]|nr:leucyl aminopeptidase family protein [Alphaproteobacteria bacterium]